MSASASSPPASAARRHRTVLFRVWALSLGPAVGIGLARFGYTILLPSMQFDLGWTYTQAGAMNTANAAGYLVGAIVAAPLTWRLGAARAFRLGLVLATVSLAVCGMTSSFRWLLLMRAVAGLGGAATLICGATIASRLAGAEGAGSRGTVLGLFFGGVGLAVLATALGPPVLLERHPEAWPFVWLGMAAVATLSLPLAWRATGGDERREPPSRRGISSMSDAPLAPALVSYFLFGLGYITYMTFVIAVLRERGWGPGFVSVFWSSLGISAFASGFIWPRVLQDLSNRGHLAARLAFVTVGSAIPILAQSPVAVLASAIFFGVSFLSVVSTVTEIIRDNLSPPDWAGGIALFTLAFSVGQIAGPVLSGTLADATGDLRAGFGLSVVVLLASSFAAMLHRDGTARVALRPSSAGD